MQRIIQALAFAAGATLACGSAAWASAGLETQGTVVVAKTQGNAIVIWDVTPAVAPLVAAPGTPDSKIAQLEIATGKILLARLGELSGATTIDVRVLYQKTGAVSPIYKAATFLGVERVLDVTASRDAAAKNESAWQALLAKNQMPPGMTVKVSGALPPPAPPQ